MSAQQVVFQYLSAGSNTLTVPPGFSNQVLVYAWGAGGGSGYNGPAGGGGGFVQGIVTVSSGDTVVISVGGAGGVGPRDGRGIGGIGDTPTISFNGGTTGVAVPTDHNDDQNYGAGGGGGAATSVLVNGVPMIVAAGGGGGGGGTSYQTGSPGLAGGVATLTSTTPRGGTSPGGYSVGGGGGAGYPFGGAGGETFGDDAGAATGGYGGQNYANASVTSSTLTAGSGITPGGLTNALYPKAKRGYAGYDGAVIVIFTKNFRAWIKDTTWKEANNAWVKIGNTTITAPTTTTATTNYSANPSTLVGLLPLINDAFAGTASSFPSTLWITFSPNFLDFLRDQGVSVTSFSSDIRAKLGNDLIIGVGGTGVFTSSEESQTSVTVGGTTYTRGSLAYTGTIGIPFSGAYGTFTWNSTVRVYNFSATTSSIGPAVTRTIEGGWKQINQAWVKEDNEWKSIQSGVSLVPIPSTAEVITINLNIAANANNYVLSDFLSGTSYYPGRSIVNLTVDAGVIVGSGTVGTPALIIDGLVSGDLLNLINNGNIAGAGGQGGAAGSYSSVTSGGSKAPSISGIPSFKGGYTAGTTTVTSIPGRPGEVGGSALYVTYATNLVNNGTIAGGGGGGGGGGGSTGGSGGGGAGRKAGSGANNGTLTAGGAGTGLGGAGGARGSAGSAGTNDSSAGGVGGSPGVAILGIDKVTITTAGTIIGERRV